MIDIAERDRVLTVTLARSPVNAINGEWVDRFAALLDDVERRDDLAVMHIRSSERAFSAGMDLKDMRAAFADAAGVDTMLAAVARLQDVLFRIERLPQATLVELGGAAMGGGFELALACDLRIAGLGARLGLPEAHLGLIPGAGGTQRLTRLVGHGTAARLILGAEVVDGATAAALGLAHWAVDDAALAGEAAAIARRIAANPPAALAACKRCMALAASPGNAGFAAELAESKTLYNHPETRALVAAFLDGAGRASATKSKGTAG